MPLSGDILPNIEIHYYGETILRRELSKEHGVIPIGAMRGPVEFLCKKNNPEIEYLDIAISETNAPGYIQQRRLLACEIQTVTALSEYIEVNMKNIYPEVFKFFLEGLPQFLDPFGIILPENLMRPSYSETISPLIYEQKKLIGCHGKIELIRLDEDIAGINYTHMVAEPATIYFDSGEKAILSRGQNNEVVPNCNLMENATIKIGALEIYFDTPESDIRWLR